VSFSDRSRRLVLLTVVPLLLAGCGGGEEPRPPKATPGPTCTTDGTDDAQPAPSIEAALQPYLAAGQEFEISEKVADTAEVQLSGGGSGVPDASATLLHTPQGWVVTSVTRC
jgi:hypothetical protein